MKGKMGNCKIELEDEPPLPLPELVMVKPEPPCTAAEGAEESQRCKRTDGRAWRCKRRVAEGKSLCEIHLYRGKKENQEPPEIQRPRRRRTVAEKILPEILVKRGKKKRPTKVELKREEPRTAARTAAEAVAGENLRCNRTDGRTWRCKRPAMEGKLLCEIHYEQGRLRQHKITVPDSLKIKRVKKGKVEEEREKERILVEESVVKKKKKKRKREKMNNQEGEGEGVGLGSGMKKIRADLIRVFLMREIKKNKEREEENGDEEVKEKEEVTRDLPYGVMAIPRPQFLDNAASLGIKLGLHYPNSSINRRFRSKNIEEVPISSLKVVPYAEKRRNGVWRECHWCQRKDGRSLVKCLSCEREFFCSGCIKERCLDRKEVIKACPVCRGSCNCKACRTTRSKDAGSKEILNKRAVKVCKFQCLQYLVCLLLPVLEQINLEQKNEVEMEAKYKGISISELEIRQEETGCSKRYCCNHCKTPIVDYHRSCPNCSFRLCLSCFRDSPEGTLLSGTDNSKIKHPGVIEVHVCAKKTSMEDEHRSRSMQIDGSSASSPNSTSYGSISCASIEPGTCENARLELRCLYPLNWMKELAISAEEIISSHDSPETSDDCASGKLKEASRRKDSSDNFLYCPSTDDDHDSVLLHFQKQWQKGHPVIFRDVLQSASHLSWDPVSIFCSYLERGSGNAENAEAVKAAHCLDSCEVEFGVRESFKWSFGESPTHLLDETLKLNAKLSSTLLQSFFAGHYDMIVKELPLQEYTDPRFGLLNLTSNLPEDFPESKLGPKICISCGSREQVAEGDLVTKLHFYSYDMVNILVHASDAPYSIDQLKKIKKLIRQSAKTPRRCTSHNIESDVTVEQSGISFAEGKHESQGAPGISCSSPPIQDTSGTDLGDDTLSPAMVKVHGSDTDSDASMICSGTSDSPEKSSLGKSTEKTFHMDRVISGSQWDVFRRQDIPKLLEYIERHLDELDDARDVTKPIGRAILDGSFFLDSMHKTKLKDELDVEPWTFNQCVGEAVFIPAGCPYQIRNLKSCSNIVLGFVSPENAAECIKLTHDLRVLPKTHKAKQEIPEVGKLTIHSINEAIKEIHKLTLSGEDQYS